MNLVLSIFYTNFWYTYNGDRMKFNEKLHYLSEINNITQTDLARKLGFAKTTINGYFRGISEPDYETLRKLAKFFNVSADYLLGLTEDPTPVVYREQTPDYYFSTNYPNFANLSEEEKKAVIEETKALTERLTSFFEKKGKK